MQTYKNRPFACDNLLIERRKILLIKRGNAPFKGRWAFPGGFIEQNETAEQGTVREMEEETGVKVKIVKLVGIYSDPKRDPRKVISAAFLVKQIGGGIRAGDDAKEARWFDLDKLPKLASDHKKILKDALKNRK